MVLKGGHGTFCEAIHGKVAPEGVGGLLKRTADRLVSQGHDIPSTEHLYSALAKNGTVRVFYTEENLVEEALKMIVCQQCP